jgi:UDPglucose 6-dehydrogenase
MDEGRRCHGVVTEWVITAPSTAGDLKAEMAQPVVIDLRNIYRPSDMEALGFTYDSVGRAPEPKV